MVVVRRAKFVHYVSVLTDDAVASHAAMVPIDARVEGEVDPLWFEIGELVRARLVCAKALVRRQERGLSGRAELRREDHVG